MASGGGTGATTSSAAVTGTGPAKAVLHPLHYWEAKTLDLHFKSKTDLSIDTAGAKRYKVTANTPGEYVKELQADLITLGYLESGQDDGYFGGKSRRAVSRFQRHAKRLYRTKAAAPKYTPDDITSADAFKGTDTGAVDPDTATEVRKWIAKKWRVPVGRFPLKTLAEGGKLREDAADAWEAIVKLVNSKGGTLAGPYGDTLRPLRKTGKTGTSKYSFHYCGRAVDIKQTLADWSGRRYYVAKDPSGSDMYWRIWCSTDKQDGTQGVKIAAKTKKWWDFADQKSRNVKEGWYVDLTDLIESTGKFERIKAQSNWTTHYNKSEWWHFQYQVDKQPTFLDELELIGFGEKEVRKAGWKTDAELDHSPG